MKLADNGCMHVDPLSSPLSLSLSVCVCVCMCVCIGNKFSKPIGEFCTHWSTCSFSFQGFCARVCVCVCVCVCGGGGGGVAPNGVIASASCSGLFML